MTAVNSSATENSAETSPEQDRTQRMRERINQIVAQAPPLTAEQRERLHTLLHHHTSSASREPAA